MLRGGAWLDLVSNVRCMCTLKFVFLGVSGSGNDRQHPAHPEQQQLTGQTKVRTLYFTSKIYTPRVDKRAGPLTLKVFLGFHAALLLP